MILISSKRKSNMVGTFCVERMIMAQLKTTCPKQFKIQMSKFGENISNLKSHNLTSLAFQTVLKKVRYTSNLAYLNPNLDFTMSLLV